MADRISRRGLLGTAVAGAVSAPLLGRASIPSAPKKPKNIILMVSDGMNPSVPVMANQYSELVLGKKSVWAELKRADDAVHGLMDPRILEGFVPDSAAAASSWGSGTHILNGYVNAFPDGTFLTPICRLFRQAGMKTGLVTTASATHATPAGFAAYTISRRGEEEIAVCYLNEEVDVVMGGGSKFFDASARSDKRDVSSEFAKKGYAVARSTKELKAAKGRVLGLFAENQTPYEVDRVNTPALKEQMPSLREMSLEALRLLKGGKEGFFLMIEGARVDHAAHNNDAAAIVGDQLAFESAVEAVLEYARNDGETLVVITSDHGCGGPTLNYQLFPGKDTGLYLLPKSTMSFEVLMPLLKDITNPDDYISKVKEHTGATLTPDQAKFVIRNRDEKILDGVTQYGYQYAGLGMVMSRHWNVGWTGTSHNGDTTWLSAVGPGKEQFEGVVLNRTFFEKFLAFKGLKFVNPSISVEEAYRQREAAKTSAWMVGEEMVGL